jgi:hypothetical protein
VRVCSKGRGSRPPRLGPYGIREDTGRLAA